MARGAGSRAAFFLAPALLVPVVTMAQRASLDRLEPVDVLELRNALIDATNSWRPFDGRASLMPSVLTGDARSRRTGPADPALFVVVAGRVEELASRQRDAETLGLLGLVRLFERRSDDSVSVLESAVKDWPQRADLLSDLSVAYLARAQNNQDPSDYVLALEAADEAVSLDPEMSEARFNLALLLQCLSLPGSARRAWQEYFERDGASEWASEAFASLKKLDVAADDDEWQRVLGRVQDADEQGADEVLAGAARRFPHKARLYVLETLVPEWAEALQAGHEAKAEKRMRAVSTVGNAIRELQGDESLSRIESAVRGANAESSRWLAEAYAALRSGQLASSQDRLDEAERQLARASEAFARAGVPASGWIEFLLASCAERRGQYGIAAERLRKWLGHSGNSADPYLWARMSWVLGVLESTLGRPVEGLLLYREALALLGRVGDREGAAMLGAVAAYNQHALGDAKAAWRSCIEALAVLRESPRSRFAPNVVMVAARFAQTEGRFRSALRFRNEQLSQIGSEPSVRRFDALVARATILGQQARDGEARADLAEAGAIIDALGENAGLRKKADLWLAEGRLAVGSSPAHALRVLTDATAVYRRLDHRELLALSELATARAALGLGNSQEAEAHFEAALGEIASRPGTQLDDEGRRLYFEQSQAVFEQMIALQARKGDAMRALEYAERARARVLLDNFSRSAPSGAGREAIGLDSAPVDAGSFPARLPARTVVLEYEILEDQLLLWLIRADGIQLLKRDVRRSKLEERLAAFASAVASGKGASEWKSLSEGLYGILVQPAKAAIANGDSLVIIPHRRLHGIPFAALVDPLSGRFLVEDHALTVSPSTSIYLAAAERSRRQRSPSSPSLIVGSPGGDSERLPALIRAEMEARRIAGLYRSARLLIGQSATKEQLLEDVGSAGIFHFAGHAIVSSTTPGLSRLVLASSGDGSRAWYAHEVGARSLSNLRLAVLSACETAAGRLSSSEGVLGLARFFLAAGVPSVLANDTAVDDRATEEIMLRFHKALQDLDDPAEALRRAQTGMLRSTERASRAPVSWAGVKLFGGSWPRSRAVDPRPVPQSGGGSWRSH